jgi:inosine-uridine nucleoside N-ribohydrolase
VLRAGRRACLCLALCCAFAAQAQAQAQPAKQRVIVDTDIGDDIDDAFALALLLSSPEFEIVGVTTAWGDTPLRVRLVRRLLREIGRADIPVAEGIATPSQTPFTQARWAQRGPPIERTAPAVDFLLDSIRRHPGEITLLALGPLTNLGAAIKRDPATFRGLKRVVLMGGSVRSGYRKSPFHAPRPPDREYNIVSDIAAAQAVFGAGVSLVMMPLDSTQIRFEETARNALFAQGTPLTDTLTLLYHQWVDAYQPWSSQTPTLFDVVPVGYAIDPGLCPTAPLRIVVDEQGATRPADGVPNAEVCIAADAPRLLDLFMQRVLRAAGPAAAAR